MNRSKTEQVPKLTWDNKRIQDDFPPLCVYWAKQVRDTSVREALEAACKRVCHWCHDDTALKLIESDGSNLWSHFIDGDQYECKAAAIRELMERVSE